jgi:hypothetical protein
MPPSAEPRLHSHWPAVCQKRCVRLSAGFVHGITAQVKQRGEEYAMTRVRQCVFAGLASIAAMTSGNASAQDCPGLFKWACPDSASSSRAAGEGIRREQSRAPAKQARRAADGATPQQRRSRKATAAKATGQARSGEGAVDRSLARDGERQVIRLDPNAMNDREKEALFQEFVEWQKARRLD